MSKKWTNPPLTLRPATASSTEEGQDRQDNYQPIISTEIMPSETLSNNPGSLSHRDSTLSDAQYAFAAPRNQYLDLPSAVPFQDFVSPALPSAEFPSSARDFVSPPGTSSTTTTGFPADASAAATAAVLSPSSSSHHTVATYHIPKLGNKRQSTIITPILGNQQVSDSSAAAAAAPAIDDHPINSAPTSGATALRRADSSVSYDSVWSGEGSQQHIALDITQFPRPPDTPSDEPPSARSSPNVSSFNPSRKQQQPKLKPPASPLYEESEPSASRPLTPDAGQVSYEYPVATSSQQQSSTSLVQAQEAHDAESLVIQYLRPQSDANGLILPSLAPTSARGSYQSHMTAASRGSSSPRLSIGDVSARASAVPSTSMAWENVMNSVKPHWNSSESPPSVEPSRLRSTVMSTTSTNVAVGTSTIGHDDGLSISAPPIPPSTLMSPFSGDSGSDVYSAIRRMSFPKPPILPATSADEGEPASPISLGPPRSPWVTGVALKTKRSRGSLKRRTEGQTSPPLSPTVLMPLGSKDSDMNPLSPSLILSSPVEDYMETVYSSGEKGPRGDGQRLDVPTESRHSALSVEAPSYDRRVSDLLRAATAGPVIAPRDSITSTGLTTSDSQRSSIDGAVVGVARAASLSARAKALLTRGPSTSQNTRDPTLSYLVPSPSTSVGPSESSLVLAPSILARVAPRTSPDTIDREEKARNMSSPLVLPPTPPAKSRTYGSGYPIDDYGETINLQRFQLRDIPHSAVPLNQSTPFQNYFPSAGGPSSYRHPLHNNSSGTPPDLSNPSLSRSPSKKRRSSVITTLSRASSRAAKAMSWFRKKPLPALPPSATEEKQGKVFHNPDEDMSVPDLARRAAAMDHYLAVGELPYSSPTASPAPPEITHIQRNHAPRASIASVLSSLSDRARRERRTRPAGFSQIPEPKVEMIEVGGNRPSGCLASRRKTLLFFGVLWCILAITIPVAVVLGRRAISNNTVVSNCANGLTGASCQLNSTCVCTSTISGRCDPVAQSLVDLVPTATLIFGMNVTANDLALQLWDLQGQPASDCASQAILVDVSPALNATTSPKRTGWARTAILYNLLRTYDLAATESFRSSISRANFGSMQDNPVDNASTDLKFTASGFVFDAAAMTFSANAVSWIADSGVVTTQAERVGSVASQALDRMYSFASASSKQRSSALSHYWTSDMQLQSDLLPKFISAISTAPILLGFDATSSIISDFLSTITSNDGSSFPAALACYPGLSEQARANVNMIEHRAFDLAALGTPPSALESACFPDRPVYGVLDVLRLRRPFGDAREGMRIPTAELTAQAGPRTIVHGGEQLVGLTGFRDNGPASSSSFTTANADPREYGTLQHLDHVALSYLQAFPTVDLAKQAAQFIMDANDETLPPTSGNGVADGTALDAMPTIEVAVFGSVLPTDISVFRADLATPNGTLFFGSKSGEVFRQWALREEGDLILWSNSSTSQQVVQESTSNNTGFETVWNQAADLISAAAEVGRGTGLPEVQQIMRALQNAGLFQ